jgi:Transposase IS66 family
MHARRKFHEARTSDPTRSHLMLAWVAGLYEVEDQAKKARKKHPEWDEATWYAYRSDLRIERSKPILETIPTWLETERAKVLPKSPIGEAIGYALNHWDALIRPWEAGFLEIDNGASERAMKPVALGRNYADLEIMRSRYQDRRTNLSNAPGSTPHNPITGCPGIRAACLSGDRDLARATSPSPSSAPPPSSSSRPRRTGASSRGSRAPATGR